MNTARRKELSDYEDRLQKQIGPATAALLEQLDQLHLDFETVKDAEQEARDNLPESLQSSERAEAMDEAISTLEDLLSSLEEHQEAIQNFSDSIEELIQKSDEAKGPE